MDDITSSRKTRPVRGTTLHDALFPMPKNSKQRKSRNYSGAGFNLDDREMLNQARPLRIKPPTREPSPSTTCPLALA